MLNYVRSQLPKSLYRETDDVDDLRMLASYYRMFVNEIYNHIYQQKSLTVIKHIQHDPLYHRALQSFSMKAKHWKVKTLKDRVEITAKEYLLSPVKKEISLYRVPSTSTKCLDEISLYRVPSTSTNLVIDLSYLDLISHVDLLTDEVVEVYPEEDFNFDLFNSSNHRYCIIEYFGVCSSHYYAVLKTFNLPRTCFTENDTLRLYSEGRIDEAISLYNNLIDRSSPFLSFDNEVHMIVANEYLKHRGVRVLTTEGMFFIKG